jgi:hypothetical protein
MPRGPTPKPCSCRPLIEAAGREAGTERYLVHGGAALGAGALRHLTMSIIDAALAGFGPGPTHALAWLALLEALRLGARLGRKSCPECASELAALLHAPAAATGFSTRRACRARQAGVADSMDWLRLHPQLLAVSASSRLRGSADAAPGRRAAACEMRASAQQSQVLRLSIAELLESLREDPAASQLDLESIPMPSDSR